MALAAGVFHKKSIVCVSCKTNRLSGRYHFSMMGYKVHYLVDTMQNQSVNTKTTIFVGVQTIEDSLFKLGLTFDYAVFDET